MFYITAQFDSSFIPCFEDFTGWGCCYIVSSILHHANFDSKQIPVYQHLSAWKYTMSIVQWFKTTHEPIQPNPSYTLLEMFWRISLYLTDDAIAKLYVM